jgi:hypothetical protein
MTSEMRTTRTSARPRPSEPRFGITTVVTFENHSSVSKPANLRAYRAALCTSRRVRTAMSMVNANSETMNASSVPTHALTFSNHLLPQTNINQAELDCTASLSPALYAWSSSSLSSIRRGWCSASMAELWSCLIENGSSKA